MRHRATLLALFVFFGLAPCADAQSMMDLLPKDAAAALAIRDLDNLIEKGDKFLARSEIKVPFRPSDLFKQATIFLGINKGLNSRGSAAVVLMKPDKGKGKLDLEDVGRLLFVLFPFTDADAMAGNFGIAKGKLTPRAILPARSNGNADWFATRSASHIHVSTSDNTLRRLLQSKPLAEAFSTEQKKKLNECDILLHIGRSLWDLGLGNDEESIRRWLGAKLKPGDDPDEKRFAQRLEKGLMEVQHIVTGAHLGDGIGLHTIGTFPAEGEAAKLFKELRDDRPASTLKGLPEGNVLLAQAISTDRTQYALLAKNIFNVLLEDLLINNKVVAPIDRFTYLGVLHEIWRKLEGSRLAVYQNTEETKLGLFSIVAILDTRDAPELLRELRTLARMAEASSLDWTKQEVRAEIDIDRLIKNLGSAAYATRQSASVKLTLIGEPALPYLDRAHASKTLDLETSRRVSDLRERIAAVAADRRKNLLGEKDLPLFVRPSLTFVPSAEKRNALAIDVVHIKIAGLENVANHQYKQLLGPDWDRMRLAVVGNQIVVLLGSDVALFDAALGNLQNARPGLADSSRLATFRKRQAKNCLFEFHVSVEGIMRLITPRARRDTPLALTSLSLTTSATSLQLDAWVPMSEVRTIARKAQQELAP